MLHDLLGHPELDTARAAQLCQRTEQEVRELLTDMETGLGYLERDRRIAWEAAKTRILSVLKDRARRGEQGLSNQEIRQITHYDRNQVVRLMLELRAENSDIRLDGAGRSTRYTMDRARQ